MLSSTLLHRIRQGAQLSRGSSSRKAKELDWRWTRQESSCVARTESLTLSHGFGDRSRKLLAVYAAGGSHLLRPPFFCLWFSVMALFSSGPGSPGANWLRASPLEILITRATTASMPEPNYAIHLEVAEYINQKKANTYAVSLSTTLYASVN